MHKFLLFAVIGLVLAASMLLIVQIWAHVMAWATFIKLMITLGILVVLAGFLLVVGIDLGQHKKLKDENYLD